MKKLFLLMALIFGVDEVASATQEPMSKSNPVAIASDQSALWVQFGVPTATNTFTYTATPTYTPTGSATPTFTRTNTYTFTPTYTPTPTYSPTGTPTFTNTLPPGTNTFTPVNTPTKTFTFTSTPTYTFTPSYTNTPSFTPTGSNTPTYTSTPTYTPTATYTPTPTFTVPIYTSVQYTIGSQTPTPINTAVTGFVTDIYVLQVTNASGTQQTGGGFALGNTVALSGAGLAPNGGSQGGILLEGNIASNWGIIPPSSSATTIQYSYKFQLRGVQTPFPLNH